MAYFWPHRALPGSSWTTGFWDPLVHDFATVLRFTPTFEDLLKKHGIARLIAKIPFLAGCSHPQRLAAEHLGTFLLWGYLKKYAYHQPGESIRGRIAGVCTFPDGDADVIAVATDLLELLSLFDHVQDKTEDAKALKFNPATSGDVDPLERGEVLLSRIRAAPAKVTRMLYDALGEEIKPGETADQLWKRLSGNPNCKYWWLAKVDIKDLYLNGTVPIV